MAAIAVDLEWPRAEDYELVRSSRKETELENRLAADYERDLVRSAKKSPNKRVLRVPAQLMGWRLRAKTGGYQRQKPLLEFPDLHLVFMGMAMTPENILGWAKRVGLLLSSEDGRRESLACWWLLSESLRVMKDVSGNLDVLASVLERQPSRPILLGEMVIELAAPKTSRRLPALIIRPRTLAAAIMMRCAQSLVAGAEMRVCEFCHTPFEAGPGRERRAKSRFCSDRCRFNFHNQQRRETVS